MTDVDELVRQTITPQLDASLAASRRHPHPAAPWNEHTEPEHAGLLFQQLLAAEVAPAPAAAVPAASPTSADPARDWNDTAIATASIAELLRAYRTGELSPSRVIQSLRPRWAADGPAPAAILRMIAGIDEAATDSDARWVAGEARPLEGIPFAVKDIIDVENTIVTAGSHQTGDRVAPADATVVARLRAAGAIPVFMSATTEFACGAPHNDRYGPVPNPWDESVWTGGSSTGSAAALAGALLPFALGSDTGGSIRVPSALCGLTGIKPTYGLVPRTGVASLSWTMDHVGPMARTAEDLAMTLAVMAGPDGLDPSALGSESGEPADLTVDPSTIVGLRIGVPRVWFTDRVDADVLGAYERAITTFRELGAEIVDIEFDDVEAIHEESWNVFYAELGSNQEANAHRREQFDAGTNARLDCAFVPLATDYLRALRRRPLVQRAMLQRMDDASVDILLIPGLGATAPRLDDLTMSVNGESFNLHDVIPRNTRLFDYTGFPALMAPSGLASNGLPVGIQLIARPWQDRVALSAAVAFQGVTDHHRALPIAATTWSS